MQNLEALRSKLVLDRLTALDSPRISLDFDGSVIGTKRKAEVTAVGFSKSKKGQRSYYPLYCTAAQTGQSGARRIEPLGKRARFQWGQGICA